MFKSFKSAATLGGLLMLAAPLAHAGGTVVALPGAYAGLPYSTAYASTAIAAPVTSYAAPVTSYAAPVTSYAAPVTAIAAPVTSYVNRTSIVPHTITRTGVQRVTRVVRQPRVVYQNHVVTENRPFAYNQTVHTSHNVAVPVTSYVRGALAPTVGYTSPYGVSAVTTNGQVPVVVLRDKW